MNSDDEVRRWPVRLRTSACLTRYEYYSSSLFISFFFISLRDLCVGALVSDISFVWRIDVRVCDWLRPKEGPLQLAEADKFQLVFNRSSFQRIFEIVRNKTQPCLPMAMIQTRLESVSESQVRLLIQFQP